MHDDKTTNTYWKATALHAFASSLVKQLGFDNAVGFCRENHWDGIRRIIESPMVPGVTDAIAGR